MNMVVVSSPWALNEQVLLVSSIHLDWGEITMSRGAFGDWEHTWQQDLKTCYLPSKPCCVPSAWQRWWKLLDAGPNGEMWINTTHPILEDMKSCHLTLNTVSCNLKTSQIGRTPTPEKKDRLLLAQVDVGKSLASRQRVGSTSWVVLYINLLCFFLAERCTHSQGACRIELLDHASQSLKCVYFSWCHICSDLMEYLLVLSVFVYWSMKSPNGASGNPYSTSKWNKKQHFPGEPLH